MEHRPTDPAAGDDRSMRERMLAGELYLADDPELEALMRRAVELAERYHAQTTAGDEAASDTLRDLLGEVGTDVTIRPPLYVDYGSNITIGDRSFANYGLVALDVAAISIGADCLIGPNVQLLTPTHPLDPALRRDKWESAAPITLEDNVWLGGGVIVCPGVTIGRNSVVGAGAVVTRDIPPNSAAVGNPARVIRTLDPADEEWPGVAPA